jgi:hypothetical protein
VRSPRAALLWAPLILAAAVTRAAGAERGAPTGPPGSPLRDLVAVVHLHTSVADGVSSPLEITRAARVAGVEALVISDHFLERIAYAPWPLGRVLGLSLSRPSVVSYGVERYLSALSDAERRVPGMVVLPGVEATPYARFTGSFLARTLTLHGWHRHLLVVGITDPRALSTLPVAGNRRGGTYGPWSLVFALPAAALAWSAGRIARPARRTARVGRFILRRRRRPIPEGALGLFAAATLVAGYPFRVERFGPVGPDAGDAPYRFLIERTRALGGLSLWAHPEAAATREGIADVLLDTAPYPDLAARTGADAFGALPEGTRVLLPPGGLWDRVLIEAAAGRGRPLYAFAELDGHGPASGTDFGELQTVFQVHDRSRAGLLEALRAGRMYGRWTPRGRPPLCLELFRLETNTGVAGPGDRLATSGPLIIRLAVAGGDGSPVTARLVRNGRVLWSRRAVPPLAAAVDDTVSAPAFYRLDVEGAYPYRLVGNPVFAGPVREAA